jgi:hypothetical protein
VVDVLAGVALLVALSLLGGWAWRALRRRKRRRAPPQEVIDPGVQGAL